MADSQTNININIDTSQALANLQALQSQISAFQTSMARGTATQAANAAKLRQNLINDINATKKFAAGITDIKTTTESFTTSLEKNKFSMGQYFKYAGGATKNFGKLFKTEMATIDKVARERVKDLQTQYIQLGRDANGAMKAISVRPLVLDMENLGTKTAIAAQKQQILNQLLKQGSTNMLNWGKNTQWAGRQLMVGFTVPLTMAGTAAAKAFMDMEQAAIKFSRVYGSFGTTTKDVDAMVDSVKRLASEFTKYGVAVSDTMTMAADAAAAGKEGVELLEQVTNATRLAILGNVDQQQALETTMSLTNAFGIAAEELTGKINFLNAVENQTVTAIEDLTIAIPKAAPVIQQLGGDVEDLAFFLTAMKEGGINASEGANALKSGLASLINPTNKASEFLQSFGINVKNIVESNMGDVKGLVVEFASALDTLDPLNRARAIEQMFGKFQFSRLSTLFQNVIDEGSQANKVLGLTRATSEELAILSERELKKVESSPMFKFQKSIEDIKAKLVPIGEAFLKAITPVIDFVGKFLDGFNKMSEGAKSFWITTTAILAGVGPALLMTVGLVANGIANLIKMFASIKSFINRTSQDTNALGESTSYMTAEQIRAAAVAASLEQVHQTLEQRFTSEAASVDKLTQAYGRNIAAQSAYSNANLIPTTPVRGAKKFATGGFVSGPGTGTSDSIPAMLSNGEAVIPAKSVAQNPDLVRGLIAGNVKGYSQGGIANGKAVVAFGAHQPFTVAHEMIARMGMDMAAESGATFKQFSTAQGKSKRSLLTDDLKKKLIQESIGITPDITKNPFTLMESLSAQGIKDVTLLLGQDRMAAGVFDKAAADYGITLRKVAIPRDPGSPSGTETRLAISNNNTRRYQELIASGASQATKDEVFKQMKSAMSMPKMAKGGIVSGPGTGTSDSVPTLLSRGEAVIPAKSVASNPELVRGLIANNIPGFSEGFDSTGLISAAMAKYRGSKPEVFQAQFERELEDILKTTGDTQTMLLEQLQKYVDTTKTTAKATMKRFMSQNEEQGKNLRPLYNRKAAQQAGGDFAHVEDSREVSAQYVLDNSPNLQAGHRERLERLVANNPDYKVMAGSGLGFTQSNALNLKMSRGKKSAPVEEFLADFESRGVGKWTQSAEIAGLKMADISDELKIYDDALAAGVRQWQGMNPTLELTQQEFANIERNVRTTIAPQIPVVAQAFGDLANELHDLRYLVGEKEFAATGIKKNPYRQFPRKGKKSATDALSPVPLSEMPLTLSNEFADEAAVQAQTKSPSKRTRKVAKDTVDGYVLELENGEARVAEAAATAEKKRGKMAGIGDKASGFFARRKQQAALDKQMAAERTAIASELLLATDKEYGALAAQRQLLNRKVTLTDAEYADLLKTINLMGVKEAEIATDIKNNGAESKVLKERIALAAERGIAINAEQAANLKEQKLSRRERLGNFVRGGAGRMSGIGMTASMVAGSLTMIPGAIGEMAQSITPVIGGLSMMSMMIQGPVSAGIVGLVAAIGAVVYGFMQYNASIDKGIDKALAFGDALGSGTKAMQGLAEFAGNVTASEVLDRRRTQAVNPYQVVSGKTTFGESYLESDGGKAMAKAIGDQAKVSGKAGVGGNMKNQLVSAVLSGALGAAQARSIAVNLGRELGDEELGIRVSGEIAELVGPNGENVLKDGLAIRVKMMQETRGQIGSSAANLNQMGGFTGTEMLQTGGGIAAGAGAGAVAGAVIGSFLGPIGTGVGAIVGTIAGGITGGLLGAQEHAERLGYLAGATVSIQSTALEQQKQMLDSLELDYEKRIEAAKAAGDTAKADELQNKLIAERQNLLKQNALTQQTITDSFKNSQYQNEMMAGVDKAIEKKYKDTPMEDIAKVARDKLGGIQNREQQFTMKMLLNTNVDPLQMLAITDIMGTDQSAISKVLNINANLGGSNLNQVMAISGLFTDQNGKPATQIQKDFIIRMSSVTDGEQANKLMTLYSELGKSGMGWVNASVLVDFVSKNPALETKLMNDIQEIKDLRGNKLSVDIVSKASILNADEMAILRDDMEYFNSIDTKEGQQLYLQTVATYSGVAKIDDPGFQSWLAAEGKAYRADSYGWIKYVEWLAQRATNTRIGANAFAKDPNDTPSSTSSGPSASWLDDYVKGVRDLTNASQGLTVGYAASAKALDAFAKKSSSFKNSFNGLANNLYASGISQDIIDNILGMPKEEAEKEMKRFFDKNGKVTEFLKRLQKTAAITRIAKTVESGLQSTRSIYDRVDATKALALGNKNAALTSEMLADSDMVVALAGVKLIGNLKDQKDAVEKLTKAKLASLAMDRLSKGKTQNEIDDAQIKIDVLEAENNIYQNGLDIISKKAEKIAEVYDRQIKALQEVKSVNDEISRQKQGELDIADALSRGDIGAAAKAAQQLRAQNAQAAAEAQMKALEDAKQRAMDSITVEINGQKLTRADLEQKMYDIQLQVLEIRKDEIVQNELILAQQRQSLNSLIAQTAEQIKRNAEAGKPITQTITKVIKTVSSGSGGNGGGNPNTTNNNDPKTELPTTITPPTAKSLLGIGTSKAKDSSVIKSMDPKTSSDKAIKDFGTLFAEGDKSGFTNYATDAIAKRALSADKYKDWKAWFEKYSAAETMVSSLYGTNAKTVLGSIKTGTRNKENINNIATSMYNAYGAKVTGEQKTEGFADLSPELRGALNYLVTLNSSFQANKQELATATSTIKGYKSAYEKIDSLASMRKTWSDAKGAAKKNTEYQKLIDAYGASFDSDVQKYLTSSNLMKQNVSNAYSTRKALIDAKYKESDFSWIPGYFSGIVTQNPAYNADVNKIIPSKIKYYSVGDLAKGTDVVPAMLTPGEFVVTQPAVKNFGVDNLRAINSGTYGGDSVYNYSVNVNVSNTGANANDIARTVMTQIKQIDAQRLRSNNL